MTATGLAQLFSHMNYLWSDPVEKDQALAEHWYKALLAVDDDAVFEALPILAQQIDRRPTIAQIIAQTKLVVASRPAPPQLPEGKEKSAYTAAWMTLLHAWREGRLDASIFQPVATRHALYFRSGNPTATQTMVEESEALAQHIRPKPGVQRDE